MGKHAAHLPIEDCGIAQLSVACQIQQLVVRDAAPEEERQAGSQLDIRETKGAAWGYFFRLGFNPKRKTGLTKTPSSAARTPASKSPPGRARSKKPNSV